MNPIRRFRDYIIGSALSRADDVFERARIRLTYNLSLFLFFVSLTFGLTLVFNPIRWQVFNFFVTESFFVLLFFVFRRTSNVLYAGYIFLFVQVFLMTLNGFMNKFEMQMDGALWATMGLIYTFSVLGRKWGVVLAAYMVLQILLPDIDRASGGKLLSYYIDPRDIPPHTPVMGLLPFSMIVYSLYQVVLTRREAEEQIRIQKNELETGKRALEARNKDVTDSIRYARRIQFAVLPQEETITRAVPLSFIFYQPKDIVSGDFFWFHNIDRDRFLIACADCTGHGVPGAMMTVIGSSLLNQVVIGNGVHEPARILTELDGLVSLTLRQHKEHEHFVNDGMDIALLYVDKAAREFRFTSAKRPLLLIRDRQLRELKGSKNSIGGMVGGVKRFEEHRVEYMEDDALYFFTDGITDQFGGSRGKKFGMKQMRETVLSLYRMPHADQKKSLQTQFESWKAGHEQVDDVLVLGIKL